MSVSKSSILLLFFLNFCLCFSQSNEVFFYELNVQGAPFNKKVNTLFEDSIGYLWIGTDTGLYRYDGNNILEYRNNVFDSNSLPNNSINSIVEDNNQNLWIGSESFLIFFDRKLNKFKGYYKNVTTVVLEKTSKGDIWANPRNTGLVLIKPNQQSDKINLESYFNYNSKQNLIKFDKVIDAFIEDDFNRYWVGTNKGIFILNKKHEYISTSFTKEIIALKKVENNKILALTKQGLYLLEYNKSDYNLEALESYPNIVKSQGTGDQLSSIAINPSSNSVWIGTTNGLIKAVRGNNSYEFIYDSNNSLANTQINSLIFDSYSNLWVGSHNGIDKHISRTSLFDFHNMSTSAKLKHSKTLSLHFSSENNLLIGTNKGLYNYNAKSKEYWEIDIANVDNVNSISKIVDDYDKNEILISSENILYKSVKFSNSSNTLSLEKIKTFNKRITDIIPINKNEIWTGLWDGGIDIINTAMPISKFKSRIIRKMSNTHTSVFLLTSDNQLWIGTRGEGLFKIDFNNETFSEYLPTKDGLSSNAILSLKEDSKKNIWVGTRGGGLNLYLKKKNSFKNFNNSKGLTPNTIVAIEEDNNGYIWMSTQDGITRFDVSTQKFIPFGIEDGIKENHFVFNCGATNKAKNHLFFGNSGGFYSVYPNKFLKKDKIPSTVITNFTILEESKNSSAISNLKNVSTINVNLATPISLTYNQNNIVVNFSSLDLTTPHKNEYAYKLEGLSEYWVFTTASNRNANYNNLPPGSYTFKVKSSNSDGVWNEEPTVLKFTISPPFWKSNLAYLIYWIFAAILIFIGYQLIKRWYKLKKTLVTESISREKDNEHNRMKMVFFTDISHELRTPLSLILGTIEKVVKEKNLHLSPNTAQRIYNNTLRMHRLIDQIMDIRKHDVGKYNLSISKNNIVNDVSIIKDSFNDFARIYEIKYELFCDDDKIKGWYDVDILEKTLFNLLSNAFKYTKEKGTISVFLEVATIDDPRIDALDLDKNTYIKCVVRDNGMGIPKTDLEFIFDRYYQATKSYSNQIPGTGIGMELVHKLIERHHGFILVESEENVFTEFTFYLPINKNRYHKKERIKTGMPLKKNFIQNSEFQIIEEVSSEFDEKNKSNNGTKPKILLVEDNDDLRSMVRDELKKDFCVVEASNGQMGYDMVIKENPKLIISDILMPIEDGISMLERLKSNKETNNIPIFMLTAKNSEETKIQCLSLGADDYIEKPFSLEFVKWKVKNALESRKELKDRYSKVITSEPSEIVTDSNDEKFIKKLIKIIEDSMNDNLLSVEYLASEVGMSRANLYRKLQAIVDDTPVNFIKTIRLKRAAQLLKKNDLYISEIAYMTGFSNQKYFGKCFQKEYKMSPTEFIKTYAENSAPLDLDNL
ncbi:hybrid sensor histidine kinase/response regulator transcription factor [Flavobacterium algicola]|uniref:hybrid sensor histidine kinase/response regulator transcription factor n=1 Tax=Flavobacterium algicola TaxID=556529 RepID=UPI001EFC9424|nr:hybrid sensor histidine kinase/response regulator transcription factor [Flavobacterium algicola]MCG9792295.1 response regulator [Flavobacterium algicola]